MTFHEMMEQKTQVCSQVLDSFLPDPDKISGPDRLAATVMDAMRYSTMAGGKRLRPMFIMETCAMYGGRQELAEPFMAALEMIHTYSLIHDDLPAMDNDDYRRGRKTTHIVYGEGMAILAGDGLLNYAYETAMQAFDRAETAEETAAVIRALQVLGRNAGIFGMVGGQCADLEAEAAPERTDHDTLLYIHIHKTACMISSGFQIGAILAGAPAEDIDKLGQIAEDIGVAFQIQDDILDVTGDSEELGKQVGSDAKDGKVTYVTMHGLEQAAADVRSLSDRALQLYDSLSVSNDFLRQVIEMLITRSK